MIRFPESSRSLLYVIMRCFLIIGFVLLSMTVKPSQDSLKPAIALGVRPQYGFVILHSRDIRPIGQSYPRGLSVDVSWHRISEKAYSSCLCFPRIGVSTTFWDFDNPDVLGYGVTSVFFLEPFFGATRKTSFSIRSGFGLAYASRPHDKIQNPDNLSYSTRLSFALMLAANLNYRLNNRIMLSVSANYNHISNGGMKEPNKGINYPTASIGLDYYLSDHLKFRKYSSPDWRQTAGKRNKYHFWASGTAKQVSGSGEQKRYPVVGLNARFARQVSRINAINFGFDFLSDGAHREEIQRNGFVKDHKKAGLLVGNEFLLGRFNFSQQFGIYVHDPYNRNTSVYQRYGLDYQVVPKLFAGIGLKAHGHVADFLDLRIGISL